MMSKNDFSFAGKSLDRVDAEIKAQGRALYGDDLVFPGLLYAAAVRCPKPRIRIKNIDDRAARKIDGYIGLISYKDVKSVNKWSLVLNNYPFLPQDEARFHGETIALVVASSQRAAKKAAAMVKISFEELPFIEDPLKAIEKDSIKIYGKDNIVSSFVIRKKGILKKFSKIAIS